MGQSAALLLALSVLPGLGQVAWAAPVQASTVAPDVLTRARQAYNAQRFDEAIALAGEARQVERLAQSASLVLARACLERFRLQGDVADVATARQALLAVDVFRLTPGEAAELRLGTAELLFVDDQFGAAAEIFETELWAAGDRLTGAQRERLFDWWASSLDRHAQIGPEGERRRRYDRLVAGAEREAARTPASTAAVYWLAAGCRGREDLERAWSVAVAGWIQAPALAPGARAVTLQFDLDRLMREAIIPERARLAEAPADPEAVRVALAAEWDAIKKRWER